MSLLNPALLLFALAPSIPLASDSPLRITGVLVDTFNQPWTTQVDVRVGFPGLPLSRNATLQPMADGSFTLDLEGPTDFLSTRMIDVQFFDSIGSGVHTFKTTVFTDPGAGIASINSNLKPVLSGGTFGVTINGTMAAPPYFGTVGCVSSPEPGTHLWVSPFHPSGLDRIGSSSAGVPESAVLWPQTTSSIDLYLWDSTGAVEFEVYEPHGLITSFGLVRRGETKLLTLDSVITHDITINLAAYPNAARLLWMHPSDHAPDASDPSGSARSFDQQRRDSRYATSIDDSAPNFALTQPVFDQDLVIEIWSRTLDPSGNFTMALTGYQFVPGGQGDQIISF